MSWTFTEFTWDGTFVCKKGLKFYDGNKRYDINASTGLVLCDLGFILSVGDWERCAEGFKEVLPLICGRNKIKLLMAFGTDAGEQNINIISKIVDYLVEKNKRNLVRNTKYDLDELTGYLCREPTQWIRLYTRN